MLKIVNKEELIQLLVNQSLEKEFINKVLDSKKYQRINSLQYLSINSNIIKVLYEQYNVPFYKIGMLCGVSDATAKKYCLQQGVINKKHQRGINSQYDNFFSVIDSPEKAYFLGFWFADGSVVKHKSSYIVSMTITHTDKYLLEKFLKISNIISPIYTIHKEDKNPRCQLNINSKQMYEDLIKLGCVPNKSHQEHLQIPTLDDHLKSHFMRGFFDGDGIGYSDGRIGFCGHYDILKWIYQELDGLLINNKVSITFNKKNSIYYLTFSKKDHIQKIVQYMYKDSNELYLIRKYNLYRPLL